MSYFSRSIVIIFLLSITSTVFAQMPTCPDFGDIFKGEVDTIVGKIDACKDARKNGTSNTIEEYNCPSGEFIYEDHSPLTDERLSYNIAVNLLVNKSDKLVKEYIVELQSSREKDALLWTENIRSCLWGKDPEDQSLLDVYTKICDFATIQKFLNTNSEQRKIIQQIDNYPQQQCRLIAKKKIRAWEAAGYNLMQDNVHQSFANDRDNFFKEIHEAYFTLTEKLDFYRRVVLRASSKLKVYIREAVK